MSQGLYFTAVSTGTYTPLYASPQQMAGKPADPGDDVYALGVIWYQLLTGDLNAGRPGGNKWHQRLSERGLTPAMVELLQQCFEDNPEDRPKDASELAQQLGTLLLKEPNGEVANSLGMRFAWCPPGTFLMGSPDSERGRSSDEGPQHRVMLTQGFYLSVHQVTQAQWQAVMGSNPSYFEGDTRPVETVSWKDCQKFCRKLGEREGKRYRLPTEAEWEYVCRAGTATEYCSGNGLKALRKVGWCSYDGDIGSAEETKPVGQFQPNAWGLYDMHGNVWEWCQDGKRIYTSGDIKDPKGPDNNQVRVIRGGSWDHVPRGCRAAFRGDDSPSARDYVAGCRIVLCLD